MLDDLISKWAQERLLHGPLSHNPDVAKQVSDAVTELRSSFSPKTTADAVAAVDTWASEKFMNAPPLTHNTPAVNQLRTAIADLKVRLTEALPEKALAAPPPSPPVAKPTINQE